MVTNEDNGHDDDREDGEDGEGDDGDDDEEVEGEDDDDGHRHVGHSEAHYKHV